MATKPKGPDQMYFDEIDPPPTPEELAFIERMIERARRKPPDGRVEVLSFTSIPPEEVE